MAARSPAHFYVRQRQYVNPARAESIQPPAAVIYALSGFVKQQQSNFNKCPLIYCHVCEIKVKHLVAVC